MNDKASIEENNIRKLAWYFIVFIGFSFIVRLFPGCKSSFGVQFCINLKHFCANCKLQQWQLWFTLYHYFLECARQIQAVINEPGKELTSVKLSGV